MEGDAKTVKAVTEYVAEVSRLAKTGKATEHTFRGALAALIDALAPGLKAVNEPKRTDCGAPDYIVQDKTGLGVFYVEAKDLGDDDLDGKKRAGHKEQFDRYKAALDTIIFTDYLDFRLYRHGQFASSVRIADWDGEGKVSGRPAAYADFAAFVADAAAAKPQKIDSAKRLAELMAGKARLLQRNAAEYLAPSLKLWRVDCVFHVKGFGCVRRRCRFGHFCRTYEIRSLNVDPNWNLVKVTRRGLAASNESVSDTAFPPRGLKRDGKRRPELHAATMPLPQPAGERGRLVSIRHLCALCASA